MSTARRSPQNGKIQLELSQAQVGQVLNAAGATSATSLLLSSLGGPSATFAAQLEQLIGTAERDGGRMSRSLLSGLLVLASFPQDGGYLSTVHLARALGMNTSTTHRYVSTLLAAGLLERDPTTRQYRRASAPAAPGSR